MVKNSLMNLRDDVAKEWHYEKNGDLKPSDVLPGSGIMVWWKCEKGHEWQARISDRTRTPKGKQINGTGCPYCNNRKVCSDNNLEVKNQKLSKEWHPTKNGDLKPSDVVPGSGRMVWWKCEKGHEWEAKIVDRNKGKGCPYCANQKVSKENSLACKNKDLTKEWHPTKNGDLTPYDVTPGSGKKAWWKCDNGHEWEATINSRNRGRGCPMCNDKKFSFPQMAIYYYFCKVSNYTKNNYKYETDEGNFEVDVFEYMIKFGVEYDGVYWHKDSYEKDLNKSNILNKKIKLIRIRECGLDKINGDDYVRKNKEDGSLEDAIKYLFNYILMMDNIAEDIKNKIKSIDINIERDKLEILSLQKRLIKENSIANKYPEVAIEFHEELNNGLKPEHISCYSKVKLWWKCSKNENHIWKASAEKRCGNKGRATGCPYCNNRKTDDTNSLAATRLDLKNLWDYKKNTDITPDDVVPTSEKVVWWKCDKNPDHQWEKTIKYVSETKGTICPFCREIEEEANTLKIKRPDLYRQVHPTKNPDINILELKCNSNSNIWWICEKGHEWEAVVSNRNRCKISKCPICTKSEKVSILANEKLKLEWNDDKNEGIDIKSITIGSNKKVWWKCEKGHEWEATVANRSQGKGCPYCSGQKVCKDNSLEAMAPALIEEWNYEKNIDINPDSVVPGSNKKAWWKCKKGHEWEAKIADRYNKKRGCPYCSGQKVCKDNSLETLRPDIAREWNYEKNGELKPSEFTVGSGKKVWWKCDNGHEWEAIIGDRTRGRGCKQCKKNTKTIK